MNQDPEAKNFANTRIRPVADQIYRTFIMCRAIREEWYSRNLATKFPSAGQAPPDVVDDGADRDGRHPITDADVHNLINRCLEFVAELENGGAMDKLNTVLTVAVNTLPDVKG